MVSPLSPMALGSWRRPEYFKGETLPHLEGSRLRWSGVSWRAYRPTLGAHLPSWKRTMTLTLNSFELSIGRRSLWLRLGNLLAVHRSGFNGWTWSGPRDLRLDAGPRG